jgi:catalase
MEPTVSPTPVPHEALASVEPDFLEHDLVHRLSDGPVTWRLMVTFAQPGDPSNDATKAWPSNRKRLDVGTLVVQKAEAEANGSCRDFNYDPTILPTGIAVSDDPLLAARSAAYAKSFDLRTAEAADYPYIPRPAGGRP